MIAFDILIPAYNSEKTIDMLLSDIENLKDIKPQNVIIVNDGSSDNTAKILSVYSDKKYKVITLTKNHGKGYALIVGINYFLENSSSQYLIFIDADLQHPVELIPYFIKQAQKQTVKIIIGKRRFKIGKMPFLRIISNSLTSRILSLLTRQKIEDSQCGYRCIDREVLSKIQLKEPGFQMESEFIIKAAANQYKIEFIEIPTIYNGQRSSINHFGDTFNFIKLTLKALFLKNDL